MTTTAAVATTGGPRAAAAGTEVTAPVAETDVAAPVAAETPAITTGLRVEVRDAQGWFTLCPAAALTPGRGMAALLRDGTQAAVFLDRAGRPYVVGNRDPFTGAYVLSRGLLGTAAGEVPFVASPLLKQRFDLRTGRCLDDDAVTVPVFPSRTA